MNSTWNKLLSRHARIFQDNYSKLSAMQFYHVDIEGLSIPQKKNVFKVLNYHIYFKI